MTTTVRAAWLLMAALLLLAPPARAEDAAESRAAVWLKSYYDQKPAPKTGEQNPWSARLDLGFSGAEGNVETHEYRAALTFQHRTRADRWKSDLSYLYGEQEQVRSVNKFSAATIVDFYLPGSPWSVFTAARYDYDEFEYWVDRVMGHAGVGYSLSNRPWLDATVRAGAGAVKEFQSEDKTLTAEALLGGDVTWMITPHMKLQGETTFYPDLIEGGQYRIFSKAAFTLKTGPASRVSLGLGIQDEYQSMVDPGFKHNDLKYFGVFSLEL